MRPVAVTAEPGRVSRVGTARLDHVELKATVSGGDVDRAMAVLGLVAMVPRRSRVYFCELPPRGHRSALLDNGVILRLRARDGAADDSSVTLRPCRRTRLAARWTELPDTATHRFRIGERWTAGGRVESASLTRALAPGAVDAAAAEDPGRVWSTRQRSFAAECADVRFGFDGIEIRGPVRVHGWSVTVDGIALALHRWTVADLDLLEFSARVPPADAGLIAPVLAAVLRRRGLDPEAVPGSGTELALAALAAP